MKLSKNSLFPLIDGYFKKSKSKLFDHESICEYIKSVVPVDDMDLQPLAIDIITISNQIYNDHYRDSDNTLNDSQNTISNKDITSELFLLSSPRLKKYINANHNMNLTQSLNVQTMSPKTKHKVTKEKSNSKPKSSRKKPKEVDYSTIYSTPVQNILNDVQSYSSDSNYHLPLSGMYYYDPSQSSNTFNSLSNDTSLNPDSLINPIQSLGDYYSPSLSGGDYISFPYQNIYTPIPIPSMYSNQYSYSEPVSHLDSLNVPSPIVNSTETTGTQALETTPENNNEPARRSTRKAAQKANEFLNLVTVYILLYIPDLFRNLNLL